MARPVHKGATLTLERQLEQLRETLPPGEQQILGRLLDQVAELRSTDHGPRDAGGVLSEMPGGDRPGDAGEMPTDMEVAPTGDMGNGNQMPTTAGDMPTSGPDVAATATPGGDLYPGGTSEMPEARVDVADTSTAQPVETAPADELADAETAIVNEMPSAMPGFGGSQEMPVAMGIPQ